MKDNPQILYGTAWKEDATEELVLKAIELGFRGIDTANQRRHYNEIGVGKAISKISKNDVKREELFIQTKYTYANGQDHRIPYDIHADYSAQVRQSFESSLQHLQTEYIDSYILHGPSSSFGWTANDEQVWQEMEAIQKEGKTSYLGVSNISIEQLKIIWKQAKVKPSFVQNRCYAQQGWDKEIRAFCKENKVVYQGFSLLTANPFVFPKLKHIVNRVNKTPAQVILRFSMHIGILPLTGTTNPLHMKQDLELDFHLEKEEIKLIEESFRQI
ncbi:aldo/keto reductase [Candidatus Woesearchaeota archaeon]|nr:aldo/keto reductase [Candidatus Woesearchaeota archaeon]